MANWQNVDVQDDIVALIREGVRAAFKEATGQDMPENFSNWSFQKRNGTFIYGIEMDAAARALAPRAKDAAPKGGNVAPTDAETRKAIVAWVEYITAGHGKLNDVPEVIRAAVSRALQPVESLMPPAAKAPTLLPPALPAKDAPAKGTGMISSAALKAQMRRAEKARKAG